VPFTRLLGGPGDYTAGIFDVLFDKYKKDERVHSTVAKQLAVMVTLYSPHQMAADLPENYEGKPAFQFVRDLAADWDETIVLNAEVGDYLTTVRKAKGSPNWFLGSTTDENARELSAPLSFLEAGKTYVADIYADGPGADWKSNPFPVAIQKVLVTKDMTLQLKLAPGGGTAISFKPATEEEAKTLPTYGK
jgi:hypothetical protein